MIKGFWIYWTLLFWVSGTLFGCVEETRECSVVKSRIENLNIVQSKENQCIVLCDFSSSMDTASIQYVRETALDIFDNFYNKANIEYFPVTDASRKPFFRYEGIDIEDVDTLYEYEEEEWKNCMDAQRLTLNTTLSTILDSVSKKRESATFLVQSIENAVNRILQIDSSRKNKHVIFILSDMRECGSSSFGTFDLDHRDVKTAISKLELVEGRNDLTDLADFIEFRVAYYSEKPLAYKDMCRFWTLVFSKLHYNATVRLSSNPSLAL